MSNDNIAVRYYLERSFLTVLNTYRTELDWNSGHTYVICNYCQRSAVAGATLIHIIGCPGEKDEESKPRRRFKPIRRIISYQIYGEVDAQGNVIIP